MQTVAFARVRETSRDKLKEQPVVVVEELAYSFI
jgi:hypothetical protein